MTARLHGLCKYSPFIFKINNVAKLNERQAETFIIAQNTFYHCLQAHYGYVLK